MTGEDGIGRDWRHGRSTDARAELGQGQSVHRRIADGDVDAHLRMPFEQGACLGGREGSGLEQAG